MTWTYDGTPGTDTDAERRDAVRLLVGDTDTNDQLVTDEEITFALDQADDNVYAASGTIARSISALYSRRADTSIEGVSVSYSQRASQYEALAVKLERDAKRKGAALGTPTAGGISISEMDSAEDNDDRPTPAFRRNQFSPVDDENGSADDWFEYHR